ncbi:DUF1433 domain-containing protein [Listeria booriae]|uniref:DUF1433 domain-containing protein n=1 Tax=Listeria booriae TaxID=1552123 RepID=UPI001629FEC0|nr:DUF1433 domain-containing protein [Listeria booriae]MBC2389090.1 DUF1433 domain-containing protein [Listeria booriae]
MTRKTKYIIVIICFIILGVWGGVALHKHNEKREEEKLVEEYKPLVTADIKKNYHVTDVDYTDYIVTPMGTTIIHGYVNGDKNISFSAPLNKKEDGTYNSNGFRVSEELNELAK